jgi:uncharacterized protein YdaU (DUF1376 family)
MTEKKTAAALPEPMVPADVDLRGLEYMPLLGAKLFSSEFELEATDTEFRAGVRLWWAAWNQVPAASLPASDRSLCKLVGFDDNMAKWRKVKDRALHGFELCADGRLYHRRLSEQALIAWEKRSEHRHEKNSPNGDRERQERHRAERAAMFEQLRAAGATAPWNIKTADLRQLVTATVTQPTTGAGTGPVTTPDTAPVMAGVMGKTGRDGTGRNGKDSSGGLPSHAARALEPPDDRGDTDEVDAAQQGPSHAGTACRAMREAGLSDTNPGDPRLLALLESGTTVDELRGIAKEAADKGKGWPWALKVIASRRQEAAGIRTTPSAAVRSPVANRQQQIELENERVAREWAQEAQP